MGHKVKVAKAKAKALRASGPQANQQPARNLQRTLLGGREVTPALAAGLEEMVQNMAAAFTLRQLRQLHRLVVLFSLNRLIFQLPPDQSSSFAMELLECLESQAERSEGKLKTLRVRLQKAKP